MINYPYLPDGRTLNYVPEDDIYMMQAREEALRNSTDAMQPTGVVIVKGGEVLVTESNRSALKNKKLRQLHQKGLCVRKLLRVESGKKYWLCPGCATYSEHAESRAVRRAVQSAINVEGADVYLWGHWWCCQSCWNAMIQAGILNVYLQEGSEILFKSSHPQNMLGKLM